MPSLRDIADAAGLPPEVFCEWPQHAPEWFRCVFVWSAQTKTFSAFGNDESLQEAVVAAFSLGGDEAVKDFVFAVERRVCRSIAKMK